MRQTKDGGRDRGAPRRGRSLSVRQKLNIAFLVSVVIPLIALNVFAYRFIIVTSFDRRIERFELHLDTLWRRLLQDVESAVRISDMAFGDETLQMLLDRTYESFEAFLPVYNVYLRTQPTKILSINPLLRGVEIHHDNDSIGSFAEYRLINGQTRQTEWFDAIAGGSRRIAIVVRRLPEHSIRRLISNDRVEFSLVRRLDADSQYRRYEKFFKLDLDFRTISDRFPNEAGPESFLLVDESDRIIYSNSDAHFDPDAERFYRVATPVAPDRRFVVSHRSFPRNAYFGGWQLIGLYDRADLRSELLGAMGVGGLILLVSLVTAGVFIRLVSHSICRRLLKLEHYLLELDINRVPPIRDDGGNDEIRALYDAVNEMIHNTIRLNDRIVEQGIREKAIESEQRQAQLNALQSQINPHFLFNTLESIRMRSVVKQEHETANIVRLLGDLLHQSVYWDRDFVRIRDEIAMVGKFLDVMRYRVGDRLRTEIEVAPTVESLLIPAMSIQPLVENACIHGMERKAGRVTVRVEVSATDYWVVIRVSDDGAGIEAEALERIRKSLNTDDEVGGRSIGLSNVFGRLRLVYGEDVQFGIHSGPGEGVSVTVQIPIGAPISGAE